MIVKNIALLVLLVLICEAAGIIGSFFTIPAIPTWYAALAKPWFSPPNWIFVPVWTSLFFLMGLSMFLVLNKNINDKAIKPAVLVFGSQLSFNMAWSVLFFGLKSPLLAFICILELWIAVIATIKIFKLFSRKAAVLLLPYLAWVSFAAMLNFAVWLLN